MNVTWREELPDRSRVEEGLNNPYLPFNLIKAESPRTRPSHDTGPTHNQRLLIHTRINHPIVTSADCRRFGRRAQLKLIRFRPRSSEALAAPLRFDIAL